MDDVTMGKVTADATKQPEGKHTAKPKHSITTMEEPNDDMPAGAGHDRTKDRRAPPQTRRAAPSASLCWLVASLQGVLTTPYLGDTDI